MQYNVSPIINSTQQLTFGYDFYRINASSSFTLTTPNDPWEGVVIRMLRLDSNSGNTVTLDGTNIPINSCTDCVYTDSGWLISSFAKI